MSTTYEDDWFQGAGLGYGQLMTAADGGYWDRSRGRGRTAGLDLEGTRR